MREMISPRPGCPRSLGHVTHGLRPRPFERRSKHRGPKDGKDLRTPAETGPGRDDGRRLHRATSEERQAAVLSLSRTKREE